MLGIISYLAWLQDAPNMCFLVLLICNFIFSLFCFFAHCSVVNPMFTLSAHSLLILHFYLSLEVIQLYVNLHLAQMQQSCLKLKFHSIEMESATPIPPSSHTLKEPCTPRVELCTKSCTSSLSPICSHRSSPPGLNLSISTPPLLPASTTQLHTYYLLIVHFPILMSPPLSTSITNPFPPSHGCFHHLLTGCPSAYQVHPLNHQSVLHPLLFWISPPPLPYCFTAHPQSFHPVSINSDIATPDNLPQQLIDCQFLQKAHRHQRQLDEVYTNNTVTTVGLPT